jgi:hypothetical protein
MSNIKNWIDLEHGTVCLYGDHRRFVRKLISEFVEKLKGLPNSITDWRIITKAILDLIKEYEAKLK